jgi:hypothetical protein
MFAFVFCPDIHIIPRGIESVGYPLLYLVEVFLAVYEMLPLQLNTTCRAVFSRGCVFYADYFNHGLFFRHTSHCSRAMLITTSESVCLTPQNKAKRSSTRHRATNSEKSAIALILSACAFISTSIINFVFLNITA